ncbi:MAG: hypothetical protein QF406_03645 [Verrucomicrobiota bacterium]|nr:hypothetical protein [Verrucomicrobiota bacterium]
MKKALLLTGIAVIMAAFETSAQQLPRATLSSVFPAGGQQGATLDVTVSGGDLDDSNKLTFSHPGITAKQKLDGAGVPVANQYNVTIAKTVPVGFHDVRVSGGRFGVTNVRSFAVGDLPEITSNGGTGLENAAEVKLGTIINGQAPSRNYAYYKVGLKKGQRVIVSCMARELDSNLEPVLILKSSGGLELERSRLGEPVDFTPAADGDYFVGLHDFVYGGGAGHVYRLSVAERPHIDFVIPPVGEPGKQGKFTLYGRNLPGGVDSGMALEGKPLQKQVVTINLPGDAKARISLAGTSPVGPSQAGFDGIEYRLPSSKGSSNPVRIFFSDAPVITEIAAPNEKATDAQKITVPCDYAGLFYPRRDRDWVTFDAKKGDIYWVEVVSERLGAPTNPYFRVERVTKNDKGEEKVSTVKEVTESPVNIGGTVFNTTTVDPTFRFSVSEDGTYRLVTYDMYNRGAPNSLYRLSIRKEAPDFRLVSMIEGPPAMPNKALPIPTAFLRRGQVLPVKVMAFKRDGFNEPIEVNLAGLPGHVTASKATIYPGQNSALVLISAKDDATAWSGEVTVSGKATVNGKAITHQARTADVTTVTYDTQSKKSKVRARLTGGMLITVTDREKVPLRIKAKEEKVWEHSVFGNIKIPINIAFDAGFKGVDKNVVLVGHPAVAKFKAVKVGKDKTEANIDLNLATYKLGAGNYTLYVRSQVKGKYKRVSDEELKAAKDAASAADKMAKETKAASDAAAKNKDATAEAKALAKKKSDEAAAAKKTADALVKKLTGGNKAGDITATFLSSPIRVKVTSAPVDLKPIKVATINAGGKVDVVVDVARKYEFKDEITISSKSASGISVANGKILKDQSNGKLTFTVGKNVKPGDYNFEISAKMTLNKQNITVKKPVSIKVTAAQ